MQWLVYIDERDGQCNSAMEMDWKWNCRSEYADWRPGLGALLHPVPFPKKALADKEVQESVLSYVMRRLAKDPRCTVHRVLLPVHEPQPGWIHIAAPSSPACPDEGQLFGEMVSPPIGATETIGPVSALRFELP
jgi:hypothetical protein